MAAVFGASLVGGLFQMVLGYFIPQNRRFIPTLVSGVVVMTIGLTLLPVGIKYSAGCGAYPLSARKSDSAMHRTGRWLCSSSS